MKLLEKGDLAPGSVLEDYLGMDQDFIVLSKYATVSQQDITRIEMHDLLRLVQDPSVPAAPGQERPQTGLPAGEAAGPPPGHEPAGSAQAESTSVSTASGLLHQAGSSSVAQRGESPETGIQQDSAGNQPSGMDETTGYGTVFELLRKQMTSLVRDGEFSYSSIRKAASDLGRYFLSNSDEALSRVARGSQKNRLVSHWLHTGILAAALGSVFKDVSDLAALISAALLHDAGILLMAGKSGSEAIQHHPHLGHRFLLERGADERVAMAALQHHENAKGSGYPNGLKLQNISGFGRIVGLCDNWDNQLNLVKYGNDVALHYPKKEFLAWKPDLYQRDLYEAFFKVLGNAGIKGGEVELNDGRSAVVQQTSVRFPLNPVVTTGEGEKLDLRKSRSLWISRGLA